jgi:hypothetical protein
MSSAQPQNQARKKPATVKSTWLASLCSSLVLASRSSSGFLAYRATCASDYRARPRNTKHRRAITLAPCFFVPYIIRSEATSLGQRTVRSPPRGSRPSGDTPLGQTNVRTTGQAITAVFGDCASHPCVTTKVRPKKRCDTPGNVERIKRAGMTTGLERYGSFWPYVSLVFLAMFGPDRRPSGCCGSMSRPKKRSRSPKHLRVSNAPTVVA